MALVCSGVVPAAATAPRPPIVNLLDRYAAHDFDAVVTLAAATPKDAADIATELEAVGPGWTTARGARETPARRLIAATFALDVVRVWSVTLTDRRRWLAGRRLLAWGCGQLRRNPTPPDGERWWHLAAIGLFEAQQDVPSLVGDDAPAAYPGDPPSADGARGHVAHALARFPDEPRFRLAQIVATEISTWRAGLTARDDGRARDGALPPQITDEYVAGLTDAAHPNAPPRDGYGRYRVRLAADELARIAILRGARSRYQTLFDVEPVAGEAHLRFAYSALRLGDGAGGLEHLGRAEALLTDPVLLYLTRLYAGSALERIEHPADAITAYRRALEGMPSARTASLALTSLLIRESRVPDAYDVADGLLSHPHATDPISRYRSGDYRFVFDDLEQLKRVLP